MSRAVAMLSVVCLFLVGVLAGALGSHLYHERGDGVGAPGFEAWHHGQPGHAPGPIRISLERLQSLLDLTPEQLQQVDEILRESRAESDALRHEMLPRIHDQMERAHQRIREVLTAEQARRFDELEKGHRRRMERFVLGH